MRPRLATSELPQQILHAMYMKAKSESIAKALILKYGRQIPMSAMPLNWERVEVFVALRREGYRPNYDIRLYVK